MKNFSVIAALFIMISAYSQMPNKLSNPEKVYGLSKFWQEVNYNFIYLNKIDRNAWDAEYRKLITEVQNTDNDYEYYRLLQRFSAFLKDGHTNIYPYKEVWDKLNDEFIDHKFVISAIDDKAIITGINKSKKSEIPPGTEIIAVNGIPTRKYLDEQIIPYISSSTDYVLEQWAVRTMFHAPMGTTYNISFRLPDGTLKDRILTISNSKSQEEIFPAIAKKELLEFRWIKKNDIAYIALNSFEDPEINARFENILPHLYKARKIVIDLRSNGGGRTDVGREILEYLTRDTLLYGSRSKTRMHIPTLKAWGQWTSESDTLNNEEAKRTFLAFRDELYHSFPYTADTVKLKKKRHTVPTAILISQNTASAAEDFLIYADGQKHMTKIGEPSFGSTGQPMHFELPGGGFARVCTKQDIYPDGREFVGIGIKPDIYVKKTLADYLQNRDPVLDAAVKFLDTKIENNLSKSK